MFDANITKEHFKFRKLHELKNGDVFKWNQKSVFYFVRNIDEDSALIQTLFGKLRNYQVYKTKLDKEVLFYPDKKLHK